MSQEALPDSRLEPKLRLNSGHTLSRLADRMGYVRDWFTGLFASRQHIFYDLLQQQSAYMVEATTLMLAFLEEPSEERRKRSKRIERDADDVRRALVEALNRTFVTPLDREDIYALSRDLDDVVDYAYSTTEELELFGLRPTARLVELATLVHEGAHELNRGMQFIHKDPPLAIEHAQRAKKIETRVEHVYRLSLAELFQPPNSVDAIITIFKLREVYRHLSNAADRVDEAANILSDTLVKNI